MNSFSNLRYRRFIERQTENTKQFVVFEVRQKYFALPIEKVHKVIFAGKIYQKQNLEQTNFTNYEGRDLSVINLEKQLFKEIKFQDFRVNLPQREDESSIFNLDQTYLIIIYNPQEELIGLPINSSPTVMKVGESVIISLPDSDPRLHNLQNINNNVIQLPDRGPIFLIENIFF